MTEGAIWLLSSGDRAVRTVFSGWKSLSQVAFRAGPCPSAPHPPVTLSRAAGGSLSPHRRLETLQKQPPREGVSHTRAGQARPSAWVPTGPRLQLEPVRPTRGWLPHVPAHLPPRAARGHGRVFAVGAGRGRGVGAPSSPSCPLREWKAEGNTELGWLWPRGAGTRDGEPKYCGWTLVIGSDQTLSAERERARLCRGGCSPVLFHLLLIQT